MRTPESNKRNQQTCKHCGRIVGCDYCDRKHKCGCNQKVNFKDLSIGAIFEFDHTGLPLGHGLARGPWEKISARKYIRQDDENFVCRVGTINVEVITQ